MAAVCSICLSNPAAQSHSYCLQCKREYDRKWYAVNKENRCTNMRERHRNDPRIHMVSAAKKRAKEKDIPFSITRDDIYVPAVCPVLGIPLEVNNRRWQDSSPTIDRIDPLLGYVPGNVRVISARANRIKNDATCEELEKIIAYIRGNR